MLRCIICDGKTKKGVHDACWRQFKGFMLSDRVSFDTGMREEVQDDPATGQSYKDRSGRNVVNGLVLKTKLGDD